MRHVVERCFREGWISRKQYNQCAAHNTAMLSSLVADGSVNMVELLGVLLSPPQGSESSSANVHSMHAGVVGVLQRFKPDSTVACTLSGRRDSADVRGDSGLGRGALPSPTSNDHDSHVSSPRGGECETMMGSEHTYGGELMMFDMDL